MSQGPQSGVKTPAAPARRVLVGANVMVASAVLIAVVVIAQVMAYQAGLKWDWTSSGINSLGKGTNNLLSSLDVPVRLTSLYFKTDLEDEDQQRYRRAVDDLLGLYASSNRTKITAEWINPLSDHEKLRKLATRLRELPTFKSEVETYRSHVEKYEKDIDDRMRAVLKNELERVSSLGGAMQDPNVQKAITPVEDLLTHWSKELEGTRSQVEALTPPDEPQYSAAVRELKETYAEFTKALNNIAAHGRNVVKNASGMDPKQLDFLQNAGARFGELVTAIEQETTALNELKPLKVDDVVRELTPNGNPILVETDADAKIVDFNSVWPPLNPEAGLRRLAFKDRAFKGEEKLTSAILRATHKEQTAVVFVRFGGSPLFFGGFMPGQPPAGFAQMKQQLEDANFTVEEWDLKTKESPPEMTPPPTKTIYVVLKPTTPERNPMMMQQQPQEPPISEAQKKAVLDAIGENGRALFIAGWHPGPFPQAPVPATYEYNDYLKKTWGISLDPAPLLIETVNMAPGKYGVNRRDFYAMRELSVSDHEIVKGAQARRIVFPWCAPLVVEASPPSGVEVKKLVTQPKKDGIWGVKNIQAYEDQQQEQGYLKRVESDPEGPFDLAVAATKGQAKIVVVSSRDFAVDQVAFAQEFGMSSQGFTIRSRNPGNVALMLNSMHWLNDNVQFLDIGRPIDSAVLEIESPSTVRAVQVLTIFVWPALALLCGGAAWWVRRR